MSIFFQNVLDVQHPRALALLAGKGGPGIVAVALPGASVALYTLDCQPLLPGKEAPITNTTMQPCAALAWCPRGRLLAVAWSDGGVALWSDGDRRQHEERKGHSARITALKWTADGERLVTGDAAGTLTVWEAEGLLRPVIRAQYKEPGTVIDRIVVGAPSSAPVEFQEDGAGSDTPPKALAIYTAFSADDGDTRVFAANDQGNRMRLFKCRGQVKALHWHESRQQAIVVDATGSLAIWTAGVDGWECASSVQIPGVAALQAGDPVTFSCVWCGASTLAIATPDEAVLRLYQADTQDSYKLELPDVVHVPGMVTYLTSVSSDPDGGVIAVGTSTAHVVTWACPAQPAAEVGEDHEAHDPAMGWQLQGAHQFDERVEDIVVGPGGQCLVADCTSSVTVLRSAPPVCSMGAGLACVQISATELSVDVDRGGNGMQVETGMQIHGVSHTKDRVLVWSGAEAQLYLLTSSGPELAASFPRAATSMALGPSAIFECSPLGVNLLDNSGQSRMTLPFDRVHGPPVCLDLKADLLAIVTREGFVDLYRVGLQGEPPVSYGPPRRLALPGGQHVGLVTSVRINANGTMLSLIPNERPGPEGSGRVYVYDLEADALGVHEMPGRVAVSHAWDLVDPRLLGVETERLGGGDKDEERGVTLLFASKGDVHHFDSSSLGPHTALLGLRAPDLHVFRRPKAERGRRTGRESRADANGAPQISNDFDDGFERATSGAGGGGSRPATGRGVSQAASLQRSQSRALRGISQRDMGVRLHDGLVQPRITKARMSPFQGLEDDSPAMVAALVGFSYHTAAGNREEAYKVAKSIADPRVWESLALMCIKTRRLDVAEHCLSNMGHVQGARALREAKNEDDVNVRVALVAVHLGLIEDAEALLTQAGEWSKLIELYAAAGEWGKAIAVAEGKERMRLKSTHFAHARHLEALGQIDAAMGAYERSGCHVDQIPRMLFQQGQLDRLRDYVMAKRDADLLTWWARYCEATGDIEGALQVYEMAGNHVATVKLRCIQGDLEGAEAVVENTRDPAAAFQLAVQYESMDLPDEALRFFTKAGRPSYALRLALKLGDDVQVMQLAGQCSKSDRIEAARRLEEAGDLDRAVRLYQLGGHQGKALELCFRLGRYSALEQIASELDTSSDPSILLKCANYLLDQGQPAKALRYLVMAGQVERALELCESGLQGATLDEEVVELMTPGKDKGTAEERERMLLRIGEACLRQGAYHLACKKFTQAGDRKRGMRALLRSGDKDKIIFFAGVSRDREVYRMAANFLQALDWRNDPEVTKNIIGFYTKAKDFASLASFYESCAQMEIDEFRDYEKALQAMRNAAKYLDKAGPDHALAKASLTDRQVMVERYLQARAVLAPDAGNPAAVAAATPEAVAEAERACVKLINEAPEEVAPQEACIRVGDVFAMLVEHKHGQGQLTQAHLLLRKMRERGLVLAPYIDSKILAEILEAVGEAPDAHVPNRDAPEVEDEVDSDVGAGAVDESVDSGTDDGF